MRPPGVTGALVSGHRLQWQVRGGRHCTRLTAVAPYERLSYVISFLLLFYRITANKNN